MLKFAPVALLAAVAAAAPSLPETCTNLPEGFCSGAMVPNVAYTVPAMYGCANKCKEMNIWCQADKEGKAYEYLYCCDDKCTGFPKEKKCTVEGKEYVVGQAYEVTLKGQKECVTMWCINDKEYRTCKGKECGCKPELTPPPPQVCKKPTPCLTCPPVPPKPQPPKPQPPVHQCRTDKDCYAGYYCAAGLCQPLIPGPAGQCAVDADCAGQKGCELGCTCEPTLPTNTMRCQPVDVVGPPVQCINDAQCAGQRGCELGCFCNTNAFRCEPLDVVRPQQCITNGDCLGERGCELGCQCIEGTCAPNDDVYPRECFVEADCASDPRCIIDGVNRCQCTLQGACNPPVVD